MTKPKIVLYKDGADASALAKSAVPKARALDAFVEMQGDLVPGKDVALDNPDGAFLTMNLTEAQAKKLAARADVVDVIDDIEVFAFGDTPEADPFSDEPFFDVAGELELDEDEIAALEADPFPEWDGETDIMTPEQLALASQVEPAGVEQTARMEMALNGEAFEAPPPAALEGVPWEKVMCIAKAVLGCLGEKDAGEDASPSVEEIEDAMRAVGVADGPETQALRDVILWNIRLIYANYAWRYSTGTGVRVAIVDTGIDPRHPDLRVYGGVSYVPGVSSWRDDHYHGTHVAGSVAAVANRRGIIGVSPNARLYAVKVLNRYGSGRLSWIMNGLIWCYRARMHIVNLSLGSRETTHRLSVYNRAYEHVGRILRSRGILAVAAAGNSREPVGNPARCPSYMAVSAIDRYRRRAGFSCYGPQIEIAAPGVNIISTVPGGRYRALSGTSMAAPHVTGAAALVKRRRPTWHGDRIRVHLWRTALDLGSPGRDWLYGFGQVNAWRAVTT